jgi:L-asparagine transporter-like permease
MTKAKICVYDLIILTIILSLLLSILNLENEQEFVIAKWAICGILSIVVVSVSLLELRFFTKSDHYRLSFLLAVKSITIPLVVIALAAIFFVLIKRDDLLEKTFIRAPFMPVFFVFLASIGVHIIYVYLRRSKGRSAV